MGGMELMDRGTRVMAHQDLLRQIDGRPGNGTVTGTCRHDRRCHTNMRTAGTAGQITRTVTGAVAETGRREAAEAAVVVPVFASRLLIPIFRATTGMAAAADESRRGMTDGAMTGMIGTTTGTGGGSITTTGLGTAGRGAGVGRRSSAIGIEIVITAGEKPAATKHSGSSVRVTTNVRTDFYPTGYPPAVLSGRPREIDCYEPQCGNWVITEEGRLIFGLPRRTLPTSLGPSLFQVPGRGEQIRRRRVWLEATWQERKVNKWKGQRCGLPRDGKRRIMICMWIRVDLG